MTTNEMIAYLEKQGYEVKQKDLNKSEAIQFTRDIIHEWFWLNRQCLDRYTTLQYYGHCRGRDRDIVRGIIHGCIRKAGFRSFKDIPVDARPKVKEYVINEGRKIILEKYGKRS